MNTDAKQRLAARVALTLPIEPDFDAVDGLLPGYVDARIRGESLEPAEEWLAVHLRQSPETADVLETLELLARLEADGSLPSLGELEQRLSGALGVGHPGVGDPAAGLPASGHPAAGDARGRALGSARPDARGRAASGLRGRPVLLHVSSTAGWIAAVAASALLVAAAAGWWGSAREATEARTRLGTLEAALQAGSRTSLPIGLGSAAATWTPVDDGSSSVAALGAAGCPVLEKALAAVREVRVAGGDGGVWIRVGFQPGGRSAVVWVGGLNERLAEGRYEWWLLDRDGGREGAHTVGHGEGDPAWWVIDADDSIDTYRAVEMTDGADGELIGQVALAP
jgi:hypothetical protein